MKIQVWGEDPDAEWANMTFDEREECIAALSSDLRDTIANGGYEAVVE
jgi:hypothetical protein